jgi:hypothetical protein
MREALDFEIALANVRIKLNWSSSFICFLLWLVQ